VSTVPIITPPPKKVLGIPVTADAGLVWRKWSTWLVGIAGLSTAALATYSAWPQRLQEITPDWALGSLGVLQLAYVLVPLATSIRQRAPK
jgi:hypothetical protein